VLDLGRLGEEVPQVLTVFNDDLRLGHLRHDFSLGPQWPLEAAGGPGRADLPRPAQVVLLMINGPIGDGGSYRSSRADSPGPRSQTSAQPRRSAVTYASGAPNVCCVASSARWCRVPVAATPSPEDVAMGCSGGPRKRCSSSALFDELSGEFGPGRIARRYRGRTVPGR
jgi:hypothetical protein